MRVLVCGGRDYFDQQHVDAVLDDLHETTPITAIIHGGAAGADTLAGRWAKKRGIPVESYPAEWKKYRALGNVRAAGPTRNQRMLDEGHPDRVVAFPGHNGTADMVRKAEAAGVPVMRCQRASLSDVV